MQEGRHIQRLPEEVVNKIAAGEVVQRPGSALKEMMENSIDAHATSIVVTLNKGGLKQMQIQDNGDGIRKDDLPILCERYTTSKLRELEDLNTIQTFGFRGEALASISTVSHVMVVTKRDNDVCGWKARYNGNELIGNKVEATASNKGTCITVDDLFYNIPLRQNMYNQKESEETKFIILLMQVFSIYYCPKGIQFTLKELPNKVLFKSNKANSLFDSISNILGQVVRPTLKEIHIEKEDQVDCPFSAQIILSPKCTIAISSPLSFILFVNGRYIQHTRIKQGIRRILEQYYYCSDTNSKSRNQNTFCFLSIDIDSHLIDVNVHPNKREICFLDEEYVINRIVMKVEESIEQLVSTQTIGNVQSSRQVMKVTSSPVKTQSSSSLSGNKKIRVDYSQRKIQFSNSPSKLSSSSSINDSMIIELDETQGDDNDDKPIASTQSILTDTFISTPFKETRDDLQLESIESLKEEIRTMGLYCTHNKEILSKSILISCMTDASTALAQFENGLYLLQMVPLLQKYFYQVILYNFGCFYSIQITNESINIKNLLHTVFQSKHEDETRIAVGLQMLLDFSPMLEDYFSITIIKNDQNELILKALPILISSYEPYYGYLPLFFYNLITNVNFQDEKECLQGITRELACFYAYIPTTEAEEEKEKWKDSVQTLLFPALKRQLIVNDGLWSNRSIQLIATTDRLYRVFERCYIVCYMK